MALPIAPQFVGVTTLHGHVRRAVEFAAHTDVYFIIGRSLTPWPDEQIPPTPDPLTTSVIEPVGYSLATLKLLVPDLAGPIDLYGVKWREVLPVDAYDENARHVWAKAEFPYDEVDPTATYRQVGITVGLTKQLAVPLGQNVLEPADVLDEGRLEYIYNDRPIPRAINRRDVLNTVITF